MSIACVDICGFQLAARHRLPRCVFDFIEGGAGDESSLVRNQDSLSALTITPRVLVDVSQRDLSTTIFGKPASMPLVIAPTGFNGLVYPQGDIALARAAQRVGIPFVLSSASSSTIEAVAEQVGGNLAFQLYVLDHLVSEHLIARAECAGYKTLVLTVDTVVSGDRRRDKRNGFNLPLRLSARLLCDLLSRPRWLSAQLHQGFPTLANLADMAGLPLESQAALLSRQMDASFSWDDLKRLRDRWPHYLVIKGVMSAIDAKKLAALGVDSIVVSNHGGRQLECAPATISVLPTIAEKICLPVLIDGGFRSGSDIAKGIIAGATAVQIGRPLLYGLAVGGEEGVMQVLELLRTDLDRTMALLGCPTIAALSQTHFG
jgi:(S)-mandelate dehydrogenase